jgi:hypothetical protein
MSARELSNRQPLWGGTNGHKTSDAQAFRINLLEDLSVLEPIGPFSIARESVE